MTESVLALLVSFLSICWAAEVCYEPCGCFNDEFPFNDSMPMPESPQDQNLRWMLFTPSNPNTAVAIDHDNIPSEFDGSRPTKFIVHGWMGRDPGIAYVDAMKDAFLNAGHNFNVIIVDWDQGASHLYYDQSAMNTRVVGACTASLVNNLTTNANARLSDMHCLGTSLGGQTCGFMGKSKSNLGGTMKRVTGLDPAGPLFDKLDPRARIDKTDAEFVDNIHSNAKGFLNLGLGQPVGLVDFFPNKGGDQPPCGEPDDALCNHGMGTEYFRVSIAESSQCTYTSYPCNSDEDADNGNCNTCQEGTDCQRMGYYADTMPGRGTFFLRTVQDYPYCEN